MKKVLKAILILLLVVFLIVGGYVVYLFASYSRLDDNIPCEVTHSSGADAILTTGDPYDIVTWNLGFGAYSSDYSFFMDGGTESRARSKDAVLENILGAIKKLQSLDPDLMLLQEIDVNATRSHHVDQRAQISSAFSEMDSAYAQNYDSAYLFYPLTEPHGASRAGQITLSKYPIKSALRRSLPIESGFMKFFDLDRCYSVARIPVDNGKTLCLYNLHLSAYTSDGKIATEQLILLLSDMNAEYQAGNYVIAGGDFNKDLPGNSPEIFGVSGENFTWAQPLPQELLPTGFTLVDSVDPANPIPSCRNADKPYTPGDSFALTVDGFITSDNIDVLSAKVEDEAFAHSDHNPVAMTFRLIS